MGAEPRPAPFAAYALLSAAGALLLFAIQPIAAHVLLPWFGGAPALWTVALLCYQSMLLIGYAWAHGLSQRAGPRLRWAHTALLALSLLTLPILKGASAQQALDLPPTWAIVRLLLVGIGLPYIALSATAPLIQAQATRAGLARPYRLYAYSNLGSLLAVLLHAPLFDLWLGAQRQVWVWSALYAGFALSLAALLWTHREAAPAQASPEEAAQIGEGAAQDPDRGAKSREEAAQIGEGATQARRQIADERPGAGAEEATEAPREPHDSDEEAHKIDTGRPSVWRWFAYPALSSALLLSVSEALAADLSVSPTLWILPLGVYLLSFIVAFADRVWLPWPLVRALGALSIVALAALQLWGYASPWWVQLFGAVLALAWACLWLHTALARAKPAPARLTHYYLSQSFGSVLGALAVAVLAPQLFNQPLELPLALWLMALLAFVERLARRRAWQPRQGLVIVGALALAILAAALAWPPYKRARRGALLTRSFYGALQVRDYLPKHRTKALRHLLDGRISHGFQYLNAERRREPTAYFAPETGIGRALTSLSSPKKIGVLGLGAGTLAAYAGPEDTVIFYEINPDVVRVAEAQFTFLSDCPGAVAVHLGDGRLSLQHSAPQGFDLLALDAFSGDAIPTHLITEEAIALALSHLKPGGILALNGTNHHVDLGRVIRAHVAHFGLSWRVIRHWAPSPLGRYRSDWFLLSREASALDALGAEPPGPDDTQAPPVRFTDDHAPIFRILR